MDLDPRRLAVLAAIARRGTLAGAAAALHVTPSAVSQQLAQLEHAVGRPLVDRTGRRAVLTAAGRLLAAPAEAIAHELAEAERELAAMSGRPPRLRRLPGGAGAGRGRPRRRDRPRPGAGGREPGRGPGDDPAGRGRAPPRRPRDRRPGRAAGRRGAAGVPQGRRAVKFLRS